MGRRAVRLAFANVCITILTLAFCHTLLLLLNLSDLFGLAHYLAGRNRNEIAHRWLVQR
jgi:hypothetical protein